MEKKNQPQDIDELISRIDSFMAKGGGRMNIKGGEGEAVETHCTSCCGESSDQACATPVRKQENKQ